MDEPCSSCTSVEPSVLLSGSVEADDDDVDGSSSSTTTRHTNKKNLNLVSGAPSTISTIKCSRELVEDDDTVWHLQRAGDEKADQRPLTLRERRCNSLPPCFQSKRKCRVRKLMGTTTCICKEVSKPSAASTPPNEVAKENKFHSATDRELKYMILREGIYFIMAMIFGLLVCAIAVSIPSSGLVWLPAIDVQGTQTQYHRPWASPVVGLLGACLFLAGLTWFGNFGTCKRPNPSPCCDELVESLLKSQEAEQRAHIAQEAKQQIMAYVFHNIRVPFNAIVLGLGHLRSNMDKDPSKSGTLNENTDLLQLMLDCAETMTSVLDGVTDVGQLEEGVMQLYLEEFDFFGVVRFLSWGLKDLLYQKQISFSVNVDPASKAILASNHVIGDKHGVLQTLGNFLSKAVQLTPAGGRLDLSVTCEEILESDASILCESMRGPHQMASVEAQNPRPRSCAKEGDAGQLSNLHSRTCCFEGSFAKIIVRMNDPDICVSSQNQVKLESYSFAVSSLARKAAGVTGSGSSTVKSFAEKSGGYVGVLSKDVEGGSFYFCLPCLLVPVNHEVVYKVPSGKDLLQACTGSDLEASSLPTIDSDIVKDELSADASVTPPKSSSTRRVLLVEDTVVNRIILRKVLHNLNLCCEEAENGQVAVDLLKQGRMYDLILMDKEMPVMDGHEATRQLRLMGVKTPIIALTGNALQSDRELFLEAGVDDFQTKPLSRDKLVELLERFGVESSRL